MQRVSAVALIPLALWFVFSVAKFTGADFGMTHHWVHAPSVAVALILFICAALYHSMLGVQVVIEDYVAAEGDKVTFTRVPTLDEVPYPVKMEPNLVVEFYSR